MFVHYYHDLRNAVKIENKNEKYQRLKNILFEIFISNIITSICVYIILNISENNIIINKNILFDKVFTLNFFKYYLPRWILSMIFFHESLKINENIYRLPLLLLYDYKLPENFLGHFKSKNVSQFWMRWNLVIKNMLVDGAYKPIKKRGFNKLARFSTFFASALLHIFPLILVKRPLLHILCMATYFMLQPIAITLEKIFPNLFHGKIYLYIYGLLTFPLLLEPSLLAFNV